jgi:hypothetical protein
MKKKTTFFSRAFFVVTLLMVPATALGDRHFYRAGPYQAEPRYDRNCLSSIDISVMGGTTKKGRNSEKNKTDLLNIYGLHNMHRLGEGVPNLDPANVVEHDTLSNLQELGNNNDFGKLKFSGKFKYVGANIGLTQNFCNGFFAQLNLPILHLEISDVTYTDQSPSTGLPNANSAEWIQFLARFDDILADFDLSAGNTKETGVGDITVLGGWTYNNDTLDLLDFFDVTIKTGLSVPTARQRKINEAFSVAAGYNGHVGVPLSFDMALGLYDWFTWGTHVGGQFFLKHDVCARMKTHADQNGFIKLAQGAAREDLGNLWDVGTYLKADHIAGGFSLMVGYTYASQEDTTLTPVDTDIFTASIVNNDETLKKWRRHDIHVKAEYDFAQEEKSWNPILSVEANVPVGGKRIFNTWTIGGNLGLNITWKF